MNRFGIEKFAMLVLKWGKWHLTDGMELLNKDKIRTLWERKPTNTWASWRLTSSNKRKWKKKIKKEYLRSRKLLETKLCCRNLIKGINTWTVSLLRYLEPFLKWTRDELKQMNQRIKKTNGHALGPTSQRPRWQTIVCIKKGGRKKTC